MKRTRKRGTQAVSPDPAAMLRACRKLAADMRAEHALGWGPVAIITSTGLTSWVDRDEAAASMDRAGDRWAKEITP
jgi:hypothetical protein